MSPACPEWLPDPCTSLGSPGANLLLPFFLGSPFQPVCPCPLSPIPRGATPFPLLNAAAVPGEVPALGLPQGRAPPVVAAVCPAQPFPVPLQLVPRGHQPDGRGDAAEALQGGQLPGAQQRDQQERLLPLLEVSEGWGGVHPCQM